MHSETYCRSNIHKVVWDSHLFQQATGAQNLIKNRIHLGDKLITALAKNQRLSGI